MDIVAQFIDLLLHLDRHLAELAHQYGAWMYGILFTIVFCETGLVVTPYLPGDSLLFAAGSLAGVGQLNVHLLFSLLAVAAVLGDTVNYAIGHFLGDKILAAEHPLFKKEHLLRTQYFFEKYGGKTIVIARFVPIVRTFAPFMAGAGRMSYPRFFYYNVIGGIAWTAAFIYAGYFFGTLTVVKENFTLFILGIIIASLMPGIIEYWRHRTKAA